MRNASSRSCVRIDGVAWKRKVLLARAAALGDEQELVGVLALGVDLDLRRQVVPVFFSSNIESGASCE